MNWKIDVAILSLVNGIGSLGSLTTKLSKKLKQFSSQILQQKCNGDSKKSLIKSRVLAIFVVVHFPENLTVQVCDEERNARFNQYNSWIFLDH